MKRYGIWDVAWNGKMVEKIGESDDIEDAHRIARNREDESDTWGTVIFDSEKKESFVRVNPATIEGEKS